MRRDRLSARLIEYQGNSGVAARERLLEAIPVSTIWPEIAVHLGNAVWPEGYGHYEQAFA
jgi:hypothetical protein